MMSCRWMKGALRAQQERPHPRRVGETKGRKWRQPFTCLKRQEEPETKTEGPKNDPERTRYGGCGGGCKAGTGFKKIAVGVGVSP